MHTSQGGPWADAWASTPARLPLEEPTTADLCIVGGGITGLTTALLAARDGHDVIVLERNRVGAGTSGLTTGKVTIQHGLRLADLVRRHGEPIARSYVEANRAGMDLLVELVRGLAIDCDITPAVAVTYTRQAGSIARVEEEVAASTRLGLTASLVHDAGLPFEIAAGVRFEAQWHLHPGRLLVGLAAAAEAVGVRIHEGTPVQHIEERSGRVQVTTPVADVRAQRVMVATLLPPGLLGGYFGRTKATMSHGVAGVLPRAGPEAMTYSVDEPRFSTRPWPTQGPGGLLVVGGSHPVGARVDTDTTSRELVQWVARHFPGCEVTTTWGAHDYSSLDGLPFIGSPIGHQNVYVATGFAKWGLTNGAAAALMMQDVLSGREPRWRAAVDAARLGDPRAVASTIRDNLEIALELLTGQVSRDTPRCTHLGCRLRWNVAEQSWDCPCHGSRFDADGTVLAGPAVRSLDLQSKATS